MKRRAGLFRKLAGFLFILLILLMLPYSALAAEAESGGLKDAKEFESLMDNFMKGAMDKYHVPGVTLVAVKDGKVFLKKGYGYKDMDAKVAVDPDKTVFRTGSVSKLFTATAVMQMAEQGQVDLNEDINKYLKSFKIETGYTKPVTLANLLTHTGGFDEALVGMQQKDLSAPVPLGKYLKSNMPPVIREPGTVIQYSNHGMALAGLIVEEITGIPFDRYIEYNILRPLEMSNSSFLVSKTIEANLSSGYTYEKDKYLPVKPYNINLPPAGSFNTTADDMSRFLIAHLQKGKFGDKRILSEAVAETMQRQHFSNYEGMLGFAYGFYENIRCGNKVIEHGGAIPPFVSLVSLLPEKNVGFFISTNSSGGEKLIEDFAYEFYKNYSQEDAAVPTFSDNSGLTADLKNFEGVYAPARRPKTNMMRFINLLSGSQNITVKSDGKGKLTLLQGQKKQEFTLAAGNLFQSTGDGTLVAFKKDKEGNAYMISSPMISMTYEKLKWGERGMLQGVFLLFCLFIFFTGSLMWVLIGISKKKIKYKGSPGSAMFLANLTCLLNILFVIGLIIYIASNSTLSVTLFLRLILCIPFVTVLLTAAMIVYAVKAWTKGYWKAAGRAYYTVVTVGAVVFAIFLNYYNLIGFKF